MTGARFPHSDTLGSQLGWQLPEAYRSLQRPSSAPDAKASTVCPYQLGHKDARVHCVVLKVRANPHSDTVAYTHKPGRSPTRKRSRPDTSHHHQPHPQVHPAMTARLSPRSHPSPQDPTAYPTHPPPPGPFHSTTPHKESDSCTKNPAAREHELISVPPMSTTRACTSLNGPGPQHHQRDTRARCSLERR